MANNDKQEGEQNTYETELALTRNRSAVGNRSNLITVVPPRQNSRVFWSIISQPPISLTVIINFNDRSIT